MKNEKEIARAKRAKIIKYANLARSCSLRSRVC